MALSPSRRQESQRRAWRRASQRGSASATMSVECPYSGWDARAASTASPSRHDWPLADPGSIWLFVTVETCSISIRLDSDDPAAVVATALFGDGAAAAVVTSGLHSLAHITGTAERIWPDTLRIMGWDVDDPGPVGRVRSRNSALHRGRARRGGRRNVQAARHPTRRDRPLLLPPWRSEGDRRDRNVAEAQPGRAQPRARSASRLWQHERADRDVRARKAAGARPSRQGDDDRLRPRFHLCRACSSKLLDA